MSELRVAIADDHPIFRLGLRTALQQGPIRVVAEASTPNELLALLNDEKIEIDILLTDFMMPAGEQNDGLRLIEQIRRYHPTLKTIVVTTLNNTALFSSILALGVCGLVGKASVANELMIAIKTVTGGKQYVSKSIQSAIALATDYANGAGSWSDLSAREVEVIRLVASGLAVGEVAQRLNRSKQTISTQKSSAMRKLGIGNDAELVLYVQEYGLLY